MTLTPPDPATQTFSPERLQAKADILESNLYSHIMKQSNRIRVAFRINREQFPDPVVVKGLLQLFPRLNIKAQKALLLLRKMMTRTIPEGSDLNVRKTLMAMPDSEDPDLARLNVSLDITLTSKTITLIIAGVPEIPSRNGEIKEAFFDYQSCPGMLMADGKINFREINKYPIAKEGDNLFFITPEFQGKPGMTYDGQIIHVEEATPLEFNLLGGIDVVNQRDQEGRYLGYYLKASRTGVVVLNRENGRLKDIGITSDLDVKRLDYTTGNIGTQYICPISMTIDTICGGFRIRAKGAVTVNILDGGEIQTDADAQARMIRTGSRITAKNSIDCAQCMQSVLDSETGCITVNDELFDSTLFSRAFTFEKTGGPMTNNKLDSERITIKGVLFCGENTLYFGRRLFERKKRLLDDLQANENNKKLLAQKEKSCLEEIHLELVRLTKIIRTHPRLREPMKQLILAAQTKAIARLKTELSSIAKEMNTKEVIRIQKLLDTLESIPDDAAALDEKQQGIEYDIKEADAHMEELHLSVEGYLRRAGTLKIYNGALDEDDMRKPALIIENEQNKDMYIKVAGTWSVQEGFTVKRL